MDITQFLANLLPTDLLLTANRRLSSYLKKKYDTSQADKGYLVWQSLQVMPLSSWIEQTWKELGKESTLILNDFQELLIWEEIISREEKWMNLTATSRLTKDSWKLLQDWMLTIDDLKESTTLEVQTFSKWCKQFKIKCQELNVISRSNLAGCLLTILSNSTTNPVLPSRFFFLGFDDLTPCIKALKYALSQYCQIELLTVDSKIKPSVIRYGFHDQDQELREMVRWSYQRLLENKEALIGCVVPNLASVRNKLIGFYEEIFIAQSLHKEFKDYPFNVSAANSLNHYPIIQVALSILALNYNELEFDEFSRLLRSPFIAGAESEINTRMMLDVRLRSFREPKILVRQILTKTYFSSTCSLLWLHLKNFFADAIEVDEFKTLEEWAMFFSHQLSLIGWPGERSLNSTEFQLVERFKKILNEFVTCNLCQEQFSFSKAYGLLKKLVSRTLFQPQSDDLPIQILGILETTGIEFDHLWVAGLNDEIWPAPATPNPFIPIHLQRKYNMPHATSDRELNYSIGVTKRFIASAKEIIFSYSKFEGDRQLAPSYLITPYPESNLSLSNYDPIENQLYKTKNLEYFIDDDGPPILNEEVSGGSWILKSQATCPFQAFAKFRLHARPLEESQIGLAPHERGSLVHEVLAFFWKEIKTQSQLCALNNIELEMSIENAIDEALRKIKLKKPITLQSRLILLEKHRLKDLIKQWLTLEKLRQPFNIVSCEQKESLKVGKLELNIQIDRIDELEDGSCLIIDYKTGNAAIKSWFSDRPNEPQLPLYSILYKQNIGGILFAQIRADEIGFKGLTSLSKTVPGAITIAALKMPEFDDWPELIAYWENIIQKLAADFYDGIAKVDPKEPASCLSCHLHEFCQVRRL